MVDWESKSSFKYKISYSERYISDFKSVLTSFFKKENEDGVQLMNRKYMQNIA